MRVGAWCLGIVALLTVSSVGAHAQVSLTLGDASLAAGDSGSVNATISTGGSAVALQFDILYDPAIVSLGTVNGGAALTGSHSVASNPLGPGRDRVVITTSPIMALNTGTLATINLAVAATAVAGTTALTFAAVVISDAAAQAITPSSLGPGTITITGGMTAPPEPPEPEVIPASPAWVIVLLVLLLTGIARRHAGSRRRPVVMSLVGLAFLAPLAPIAQAQGLPGDANNDGRIDAEDVRLIVERILERGVLPGDGDCNRDAKIDVLDTVCFQLPFVPGETAPIILGPGDRSIPAETAFEMYLFAADPDTGAILNWELISGPAGLTVSATGVLNWTPGSGDVRSNPVTVRVTDDTGRTDESGFAINVFTVAAVVRKNTPPRLTVPGDQALPVGTPLAAQASASDPDAGDTLTFSLVDGPDGMTIDPASGALIWTPQSDQAGSADVVIQAMDTAGARAFGTFSVTATLPNAAPTAKDDVYIARKGETLLIPASEGVLSNDTDPNGDILLAQQRSDPSLGTVDSFAVDGAFAYTPLEPERITIGLDLKCETDLNLFSVQSGTAAAADVDGDGKVEIVGLSNTQLGSRVFIVDPTDCSVTLNPIPDESGQPSFTALTTLVNLDDDPELELVAQYNRFADNLPATPGEVTARLMAMNLDGTPVAGWPFDGLGENAVFDTGFNNQWTHASPVAVDLDGNGRIALLTGFTQVSPVSPIPDTPPLCTAIVNTTCNAVVAWDGRTGEILWQFVGGVTRPGQQNSASPVIVDLDMDGDPEIIWNQLVLDHEGNLLFEFPVEKTIRDLGNDFLSVAVANFDNDAYPEILGYDASNFYLFSHDGAIQWQRPYDSFSSGSGFSWGEITLAELDGDPFPEFVMMLEADGGGDLTVRAFDSDGEPLWDLADSYIVQISNQNRSSSPVAMDLDRDGIDELILVRAASRSGNLADAGLYILDGSTGAVIASEQGRPIDRGDEPLTVADIDGDGSAEIVTGFADFLLRGTLQIWDNLPGEPFPPARPIRSQTNGQPTWVNVDGSLPTSLEPHWLQPGRNYWNRIVPDLDPFAPEQDSFTYRVSDGKFDSADATVNIEVRPNGNPPFFLSEPDRATSIGTVYRYRPAVTDVDPGDSVSFSLLNGPAGMTIDTMTGEISWYPDSNGEFAVAIAATDTLDLSAAQIFSLSVGDPVTVPDVVGLGEMDAATALLAAGLEVGSRFFRSDALVPADQVLSQSPPAGAVAALGAMVRLTLSSGAGPADTDGDGDGFTPNEGDCDDRNAAIFPGAADANSDGIDQNCDGIDGNKVLVAIAVSPTEKTVLTGERVSLKAKGLFDDGTSQELTAVAGWSVGPEIVPASVGTLNVTASLAGIDGSARLEVVARVDEQLTPEVELQTPLPDALLTGLTEVRGTVRDANLLRYELSVAPAGLEEFTLLAEATAQVSGGALGIFDATRFENDQYTLRLQAWDRAGNVSEDTTTVQVEGQLKVGNFDLQLVDLDLPVSGLPLRVVRSYRTDNKRTNDFGVGWRLGIDSLRLTRNRVLGTAWRVVRAGLTYGMAEDDLHKVTVTLPDGRVEAFDMVVTPSASPIVPFPALSQTVLFRPRPGTYGRLEALGDNTVTILEGQPGPVNLTVGASGATYDPLRFRYTAVNGTQVVIDREQGVESIRDRNGNTLTLGDNGITHSAGRSVIFERDDAGRIKALVDPSGHRQTYRYDSNGDLVAHENPRRQTTRYAYDASHNLLRIIDPAGRNILENTYDGRGRIVNSTDSEGRALRFLRDPDLRQERVIDADGAETEYVYDERGNVTRITDPLGNESLFAYDADDNLIRETNALGETTSRTFDDDGNLLSVTDPLGNTTTFAVDAFGNVSAETNARGEVTSFRYGARGNLVETVAPDGSTRSYAHTVTGEVAAATDETGAVVGFEYNARGDQIARIDGLGGRVESRFDASGRLVGETDRRGNATTVSVDALGSRTETVDPLGNAERYSYGVTGRLETVTNARGNSRRQVTDGLGRVLSLDDREGGELRFDFDLRGNLALRVDPRGGELRHEYDAAGRRIRTTHPDGSEETFAYDAAGRVVERNDRRGVTTGFEYDAAGRQSAIINALGQRLEFDYDANGNLITETDAAGNTTRHRYDARDRRTETELPDGRVFGFTYTPRSELASETDPLGNTTGYRYDANGNLVSVVDATGFETRYRYDGEGNLIEQVDARGHTTRFEYDANNREVWRIFPDGSTEQTEYDDLGNVSARVRADGVRVEYTYDAESRLIERRVPGSVATYTVDSGGARLSAVNGALGVTFNRDIEGRASSMALDDGRRIDYVRDPAGNVVERSVVALAGESPRTTRYSYDALNRVIATRDPDGNETRYDYTPTGELSRVDYANGVTTTFTHDTTQRTTRILLSEGGVDLERLDYSYDDADNIASVESLDGGHIDYRYDVVRRLTRETHRDGSGAVTLELRYAYDAVGNRTRVDDGGVVEAYTYDAADKLLTKGSELRTYDARGNLAGRNGPDGSYAYRYDALNRLVEVDAPGGLVRYRYDAEDRRIRREAGGDTIDYLVEPGALNDTGVSQVLAESDPVEGSILAENIFDVRLLARGTSGGLRFFHRDASENVRVLTDEGGGISDRYAYDAFGGRSAVMGSSDNPYRFAGERVDSATGLIHLRARDYDPRAGRFLGRDPFAGELGQSFSRHRYLYARNNPLSFADPTGRFTIANLSATVSLAQITLNLAPTLTTGVTTIILLNKFWKAGFDLREAGYLIMIGDPRARDLLPGGVLGPLEELGYASFLAGNRLIEVGAFAIDAADKINKAAFAMLSAAKSLASGANFVRNGGTSTEAFTEASGLLIGLQGLAEKGASVGSSLDKLSQAVKGESRGPDKETLKSQGQLEAERNKKVSETFNSLVRDVILKGL
ncbi:putative Ig domain-containing protein [Haliea sp. E1-2-M8]|uniref:putative Ig domain-containing protein n=1 Tax=Haliea sp. E1-2-M8 TaxID=3064706 RepID=UPI0027235135|nr:putative Ig domain-containing protein [Haliea sp. E1-2-M8]MDO8864067.1 putative Ig domain-containing protein [Haliea sp. E1-2-M8]